MTTSILVTRPAGSATPLLRALGAAGYATRAVPTIALEAVDPTLELRPALADLEATDWLVVTSPAGARATAPEIERLAPTRRPRVAVIGPGTGRVLRSGGIAAAAVADESRPAALVEAIEERGPISGRTVVLARSDVADTRLPEALAAAGARVHSLVAYRTIVGPRSSRSALHEALEHPDTGLVVFASGSALRGALLLAGDDVSGDGASLGAASSEAASRLRALRIVTIGPATSAVVRDHGLHVSAEAGRPDTAAQVAAVRSVVSP